MEGKLTQCLKAKSEGTWKVKIGDTEYYTKQDCNNLIGQNVTCANWESEYKGKAYNWCKEVKGVGGATGQPKTSYLNEDEKIRTMVLAYAKDLCVAGKIELGEVQTVADNFFSYVKSFDKPDVEAF